MSLHLVAPFWEKFMTKLSIHRRKKSQKLRWTPLKLSPEYLQISLNMGKPLLIAFNLNLSSTFQIKLKLFEKIKIDH